MRSCCHPSFSAMGPGASLSTLHRSRPSPAGTHFPPHLSSERSFTDCPSLPPPVRFLRLSITPPPSAPPPADRNAVPSHYDLQLQMGNVLHIQGSTLRQLMLLGRALGLCSKSKLAAAVSPCFPGHTAPVRSLIDWPSPPLPLARSLTLSTMPLPPLFPVSPLRDSLTPPPLSPPADMQISRHVNITS